MGGKTDKQIIAAFAHKVKKDFSDARIILFGSRAKGEALEESDYDFIIVSKKFEGTNFFTRMEKMYDYWNERQQLESLCYTPEEFEEKAKLIGIVSEAVATGSAIK